MGSSHCDGRPPSLVVVMGMVEGAPTSDRVLSPLGLTGGFCQMVFVHVSPSFFLKRGQTSLERLDYTRYLIHDLSHPLHPTPIVLP